MNFASLKRDARIKNFRAAPEKRAYYITTQIPIQAPKPLQKYGLHKQKRGEFYFDQSRNPL